MYHRPRFLGYWLLFVAVCSLYGCLPPNPAPTTKPIAWWKFDEMTGATACDSSGHGNTGVVHGASRVPGRYAQALSLDGLDDWVEVPNSESLRGIRHLTVEAWVMLKGFPPAALHEWTGIIAYGTKARGMWELFVTHEGGVHFMLNWQTATETRITTRPVLKIDEWHHVIATYDGVTARVFVDGALEGQAACPELVYPDGEPYLAIGLDFPGGDEFLDGVIDEVLVYDTALAPDEPGAEYEFQLGDTVKVTDTGSAGLQVRSAPGGIVTNVVPDNWVFQVRSGIPETATLDGVSYAWWHVMDAQYEPSPHNGWVAERYLMSMPSSSLTPATVPAYFAAATDQVDSAVEQALQKVEDESEWYDYEKNVYLCLGFVRAVYNGVPMGWLSAYAAMDALQNQGRFYYAASNWNPPKGALVFFSSTSEYDHVGICVGAGQIAHVEGDRKAHVRDLGYIVQLPYIEAYAGWAYPPEEWLPGHSLIDRSLFCVEQGGFDYCSRFDWGYSSQWLQNGSTNEILLADARRAGTLEPIGSVDFDRIEIRLRSWACYADAWAKLTADNMELVVNSAAQVIARDDMEREVLERWTKWEHSAGGTARGGTASVVVSPADHSQALQVYVPTGIDASCAGVWAVRTFDMPSTVNTSDVTLRVFLLGEGQSYYHEGFMEILLYKTP